MIVWSIINVDCVWCTRPQLFRIFEKRFLPCWIDQMQFDVVPTPINVTQPVTILDRRRLGKERKRTCVQLGSLERWIEKEAANVTMTGCRWRVRDRDRDRKSEKGEVDIWFETQIPSKKYVLFVCVLTAHCIYGPLFKKLTSMFLQLVWKCLTRVVLLNIPAPLLNRKGETTLQT